jgi:hypothetical protein
MGNSVLALDNFSHMKDSSTFGALTNKVNRPDREPKV